MTRRSLLLGAIPTTRSAYSQSAQEPLDLGVKIKIEVRDFPDMEIKVDVRERQLQIDCRDSRGVAATLQKSDLHVIQNAVSIPVERLYPVEQRDVDIAFLFDTSSSQNGVLNWQGRDAQVVLQKFPRQTDQWFLTIVGDNFIQLGGWQDSSHLMNRRAGSIAGRGQIYTYDSSVGTPLFDAILHTVETLASISSRRKVLLILTDGIDVGSQNARNYVATRVREEDVALYVFRYLDLGFYRQHTHQPWWYGGKPQEIIEFAANANGIVWSMEGASIPMLIDQINTEIRREYRVAYKLGDLQEPLTDPKVVLYNRGLRLARTILFKRQALFQRPTPRHKSYGTSERVGVKE